MTQDNFPLLLDTFAEYHLLPEKPTVVDVGCLFGWFTEAFLQRWPEAEVLGIDLDAGCQPRYLHNKGANVRFLHRGLSNYDGAGTVYRAMRSDPTELSTLVNRNNESQAMQWYAAEQVQVNRLDGLVQEVDFIKIDAELHDLRVIQGASKLFERQRPLAVIFELVGQTLDYVSHQSIFDLFDPYEYHIFVPTETDGLQAYEGNMGLNTLALRRDLAAKLNARPVELRHPAYVRRDEHLKRVK